MKKNASHSYIANIFLSKHFFRIYFLSIFKLNRPILGLKLSLDWTYQDLKPTRVTSKDPPDLSAGYFFFKFLFDQVSFYTIIRFGL